MEVHRDSDGTSRSAKIEYQYSVDGKTYTSRQISYASGFENAGQLVNEFPKNSKQTIYYNPEAHDQAVLKPGVGPGSVFLFVFLTPFQAIALVAVTLIIPMDRLPLGPLSILHRQEILTHKYAIYQALRLQAAIVGMGAMGFAMIFVTFFLTSWIPGWGPLVFAFVMIFGAGVASAYFNSPRTLEVDSVSGRVIFRDGDKVHEATFTDGVRFSGTEATLQIEAPHSEKGQSTLPPIKCYSATARQWLEKELEVHLRS